MKTPGGQVLFFWIYTGWHECDGKSTGELRKENWCVSADFSLSKYANWIMWRAGPGCCLQGHLHVGGGCPQDARGAMSDLTNRRTTDSEEGQHPVSQRGSVLPLQLCIRFAPPLNNVRSSGVDTGCFHGSH